MRALRMRSRPSRSGVPGRDERKRVEERLASARGAMRVGPTGDGLVTSRVGTGTVSSRPPTHGVGPSELVAGRAGSAAQVEQVDRGAERRTRTTRMSASTRARARHDRLGEAEAGRLGEAPLDAADLTELAAEADLAAGHDVGGQRRARPATRRPPARDARSAPGSMTFTPPTAIAYTSRCWIVSSTRRSSTASSSADAAAVEAVHRTAGLGQRRRRRPAPAPRRAAGGDPRSWASRSSRRCRGGDRPRNSAGRIGHRLEPASRPWRTGRAPRSSRSGASCARSSAQRVVAVALERQHGVDHVLEHARARRAAPSLVTWPTSTHRAGRAPSRPAPARCAHCAHLRDRSRRRGVGSGSYIVWIESTTQTRAGSASTWAMTLGSDVSAARSSSSQARRGARPGRRTWSADSSAVT